MSLTACLSLSLSRGQGVEAIRPCPEEQEGFIRRKCEKTNNRTRGYWPSHSNPEHCVQRVIFQTRDRVRGTYAKCVVPHSLDFFADK